MGLNYYTLARALWDTQLDWPGFLGDFCEKYYGSAGASSMQKYHTRLLEAVLSAKDHFVPTREEVASILAPDVLADCQGYVDEAMGKAQKYKYQQRISLRQRSLRYARLYIGGIVNGDAEKLEELARFLKCQGALKPSHYGRVQNQPL